MFTTLILLKNQKGATLFSYPELTLCRFCGKSKPTATFNTKAHAIPEFIGNKELFSYFECDKCNHAFGISIENDFSNYLGAYRTFSQIRGKKKVPTYITKADKSRIDMSVDGLKIHNYEDDSILTHDSENNSIIFHTLKKPYTPIGIYKCLTKMALSIMPDEQLTFFQETVEWINCTEHRNCSIDFGVPPKRWTANR